MKSPVLRDGELTLRLLRYRDKDIWTQVRRINNEWLTPWEATRPEHIDSSPLPSYVQMVAHQKREAKAGRIFAMGIWIADGKDERFIGQITLGGIVYGAYRGGYIGYWIDQRYSNRGYTTRAVKLLTKFAFEKLQLHRIEIAVRPENDASIKVAEKAGYIREGERLRYLHIDGDWRDHLVFVKENLSN